jgi:hypothetical protein
LMEISLSLKDQIVSRYGEQLARLSAGQAATAMSRALNQEGNKARTQVRTAVAKQTGVAKGRLGLVTRSSTPATLTYTISASGRESNVAAFKGKQVAAGVSAQPWGQRRIFEHAFMLKAVKGIEGAVSADAEGGKLMAFVRRPGGGRTALRPVFGPNLGREIVKAETKATFETSAVGIVDRIGHEIARMIAL